MNQAGLQFLADLFALIGASLLWWPAWQASKRLKLLNELTKINRKNQDTSIKDTLGFLEGRLKGQHYVWNNIHHSMLMGGISLIATSTLINLFI